MIIVGDAFSKLSEMPEASVDCVVTSPPYWGLRDYGVSGQLGLEKTPEEYIAAMKEVFRQVYRVLKSTGTLWLNLGDSYGANYRWGGHRSFSDKRKSNRGSDPTMKRNGIPSKQLIGIPWRTAIALQSDGWILRQDIIWHKSNPMPESVHDRCTKAHEYIFLFSKQRKYYFDMDAIKEPAICGHKGSEFHTGKTGIHQLGRAQKVRPSAPKGTFNAKGEPLPGQLPFRSIKDMRHKRSVWTVSTKPFRGAHFATFPPDLIEPCILAGCPEGDTVLDPFFGAGTVGLVAKRTNRKYIGIEINPEYAAMARERIGL